jgi:hypothetical protein
MIKFSICHEEKHPYDIEKMQQCSKLFFSFVTEAGLMFVGKAKSLLE